MVPECFLISYWKNNNNNNNKTNAIFLQFSCVRRANSCYFDHILHLAYFFFYLYMKRNSQNKSHFKSSCLKCTGHWMIKQKMQRFLPNSLACPLSFLSSFHCSFHTWCDSADKICSGRRFHRVWGCEGPNEGRRGRFSRFWEVSVSLIHCIRGFVFHGLWCFVLFFCLFL